MIHKQGHKYIKEEEIVWQSQENYLIRWYEWGARLGVAKFDQFEQLDVHSQNTPVW